MEYLASLYIDNEMDLGEKRTFVEKVRADNEFATLTLDLLDQERRLRDLPLHTLAAPASAPWRPPLHTRLAALLRPAGLAAAGFAAALLVVALVPEQPAPVAPVNRFVLFEPDARQVELAGSFTGWQRVPLHRAGDSGYWELTLPVAPGEHRFAYILDGERQMADPTLPALEQDDFGGENSILSVGLQI